MISNKKFAVIDLGSHSILFTIFSINNDRSIVALSDNLEVTKIGQGLLTSKKLSKEGKKNTIEVFKKIKQEVSNKNIEQLICFGTQALREAEDSYEFVKQVKGETDIDIKIISPQQEATFGHLGAIYQINLPEDKNVMVIDIGGGSTEFSLSYNRQNIEAFSFPTGVIKIKETIGEIFFKIDNLTHISNDISEFINTTRSKNPHIIFCGGTATTTAALILNHKEYNGSLIHGKFFNRKQLIVLLEELLTYNMEQLIERMGIYSNRASVMREGIKFMELILKGIAAEQWQVSDRGPRWGVALNYWEQMSQNGSI